MNQEMRSNNDDIVIEWDFALEKSFIDEEMLAIVNQFFDAATNIIQSPMTRGFAPFRDIGIPASGQFLDARHIDAAIMEEVVQFGHVSPQKSPILPDGIAT